MEICFLFVLFCTLNFFLLLIILRRDTRTQTSMADVIFVTVYLHDINNYKEFNTLYSEFLKKQGCTSSMPARACFAVEELPRHAMIEIECVACTKGTSQSTGNCTTPPKYASWRRSGDIVWVSGMIGDDMKADVKTQTTEALKHLVTCLKDAGSSPEKVTKVTVYLADISYYAKMNEAYAQVFGVNGAAPPARAAFAVKDLPLGAKVEIQAIAYSGMNELEPVSGASAVKVYTPAIVVDDLVFCSGQVALDPKSKKKELVGAGDIVKETTQALKNLQALLERSGSSLSSVKMVNIFLKDMNDYSKVNEVYRRFFKDKTCFPARACVAVKDLPLGALVEIECKADRVKSMPIFTSKNMKIAAVAVLSIGVVVGLASYFLTAGSSTKKKKVVTLRRRR